MPDEARAYTTARGLLRQPDKQKLASFCPETREIVRRRGF